MHQSCFSFDHYVITRGLGIRSTLSITCGGDKAQELVGSSLEGDTIHKPVIDA